MKRTIVAVLTVALLMIGGPARADSKGCNIKAVQHTALHLSRAEHRQRIVLLLARFERLMARCSMPPPSA